MRRQQNAILWVGVLVAAFLLFRRRASAATPELLPGLDEVPPDEVPPDEVPPDEVPSDSIPFDPTPSKQTPSEAYRCGLTGEYANAELFPTPAAVLGYLRELKYDAPGENIKSAAWRKQVKLFQADARGFGLAGMAGADAKWIDGKMGACTLLALSLIHI